MCTGCPKKCDFLNSLTGQLPAKNYLFNIDACSMRKIMIWPVKQAIQKVTFFGRPVYLDKATNSEAVMMSMYIIYLYNYISYTCIFFWTSCISTWSGSPPKYTMLSRTHFKASSWSLKPWRCYSDECANPNHNELEILVIVFILLMSMITKPGFQRSPLGQQTKNPRIRVWVWWGWRWQ